MLLYGYKLVENNMMVSSSKQKRTHRKKRINKKWRRKYGYVSVPMKDVFIVGDTIVGHPETIRQIIKELKKRDGLTPSKNIFQNFA